MIKNIKSKKAIISFLCLIVILGGFFLYTNKSIITEKTFVEYDPGVIAAEATTNPYKVNSVLEKQNIFFRNCVITEIAADGFCVQLLTPELPTYKIFLILDSKGKEALKKFKIGSVVDVYGTFEEANSRFMTIEDGIIIAPKPGN